MSELADNVRAYLEETRLAVFGTTNANGTPHLTGLWYELRGDTIVMNTKRGRQKDRNLHRDPRASLCVEEGYRYVTLTGTISINDDQVVAQADIAALARRYHGPEKGDEMARDEFSRQERVTLTLQIERVETHGLSGEE
jgi:PPOX class probable F420-dependent enzyme